jgi:hypothetical protein
MSACHHGPSGSRKGSFRKKATRRIAALRWFSSMVGRRAYFKDPDGVLADQRLFITDYYPKLDSPRARLGDA